MAYLWVVKRFSFPFSIFHETRFIAIFDWVTRRINFYRPNKFLLDRVDRVSGISEAALDNLIRKIRETSGSSLSSYSRLISFLMEAREQPPQSGGMFFFFKVDSQFSARQLCLRNSNYMNTSGIIHQTQI